MPSIIVYFLCLFNISILIVIEIVVVGIIRVGRMNIIMQYVVSFHKADFIEIAQLLTM